MMFVVVDVVVICAPTRRLSLTAERAAARPFDRAAPACPLLHARAHTRMRTLDDPHRRDQPRAQSDGAYSGQKVPLAALRDVEDARAWTSFDGNHGTLRTVAIDRCANRSWMEAEQQRAGRNAAVCVNDYDCSVAGTLGVNGTDAKKLWQRSLFLPALGRCTNVVRTCQPADVCAGVCDAAALTRRSLARSLTRTLLSATAPRTRKRARTHTRTHASTQAPPPKRIWHARTHAPA